MTHRHSAEIDEMDGKVVDLEAVSRDRVRPAKRRRGEPDVPAAAVAGDAEEAFGRVGGKRRYRPEVVLVVAGLVFVTGALLKPWPAPATAPSPSLIAAATASPSAVGFPDAPPWDDRYPFFGPPDTNQPNAQLGIASHFARRWGAIDWSLLSSIDPHLAWGFGAASLPNVAAATASADGLAPAVTWAAAGSASGHSMLNVGPGRRAYALAVTWPIDVNVSSVGFTYLGGPENPDYLAPPGFPAFTQVSPLPAAEVASRSGAVAQTTVGPSAIPTASGPRAGSASGSRVVPGSGPTVLSGEFWIPPSEESWPASRGSVPAAWQTLPWPWPNGTYRVTITTQAGTTVVMLDLQASA